MRSIVTPALRHVGTPIKIATIALKSPTSYTTLRAMSATTRREDPFKPAKRVAGQKQDVW